MNNSLMCHSYLYSVVSQLRTLVLGDNSCPALVWTVVLRLCFSCMCCCQFRKGLWFLVTVFTHPA